MKNFLKKNIKIFTGIFLGMVITGVGVYGATLITTNEVMYTSSKTAKTAIDELYNKVNTMKTVTEYNDYGTARYNAGYEAGKSEATAYRRTFPTTTATGDENKRVTIGKSGYIHLVADWSYGGTGSTHPSNMNGVSLWVNSTQLFESETEPRGYGHSGTNTFDLWVNKL